MFALEEVEMESKNWNSMPILKYSTVVLAMLVFFALPDTVSAQDDIVYIDSVQAGPGQDVPVRFYMKNSQPLSSLSLPITYDPQILTLKSISFSDSRGEYLDNKLTTPADVADANGHFMVGFMVMFEDAIPVGDGLVFTALFNISDKVSGNVITTIDSLFFPPGGELLFVEAGSSGLIYPEFTAGKVVVTSSPNQSPAIASNPSQYIFEGDSLNLAITAADPDDDPIVLVCTEKPLGAVFVDNGDGTAALRWQTDYIGPNSSDGSPLSIRLWASDGDLSAEAEVLVNVINRNRKPVIEAAETVEAESGEELNLPVSAYDPDFEPVEWEVLNLPSGAVFDYNNPGLLNWSTALIDTGNYELVFIASDPQGYSDTAEVVIHLTPTAIYSLTLDTLRAFPGNTVECHLTLDNKAEVGSFNLLFQYDPSVLTALNVTTLNTRAQDFEYFNVTLDDNQAPGLIRAVGIADNGGSTEDLAIGDGPILTSLFRISSNINYSGMNVPVRFRFIDALFEDNTLTDALGNRIEQAEISYYDGWVNVLSLGEVRIGDINLNRIAYEIGDAIYLTNHFINPVLYPLNPLQYANSDVNFDGVGGTIGDLVTLINIIVNGISGGKLSGEEGLVAGVYTEASASGSRIICRSDFEVGGVLLTLDVGEDFSLEQMENLSDDMTIDARLDGSRLRVLIYSLDGASLEAGEISLFGIGGYGDATIISASISDAQGQMAEVNLGRNAGSLPQGFTLYQNYPNPFNPDTRIDFDLPQSSKTALAVFNVLGRKVRTLIDGQLPAGSHTVVWDGRQDDGNPVASGIYLYRLETQTGTLTRKMMLLK